MIRRWFSRWTLPFALVLAVGGAGCATFPKEEMDAAQGALGQARQAQADKFAPGEYSEAQTEMVEAQRLASEKNYSAARDHALSARGAAERAVSAADKNREVYEENERRRQEEETRAAEEEARRQAEEEAAAQLAAAQAAEAAESAAPAEGDFVLGAGPSEETIQEADTGEAVAVEAPPPPPPARAEVPSGTGETRSYRVRRYETLSDIAAREDVYGESDLWPILFDANRDLIRDPDRLPRVTIQIPLEVSEADKEEARVRARSHVTNLWDGE